MKAMGKPKIWVMNVQEIFDCSSLFWIIKSFQSVIYILIKQKINLITNHFINQERFVNINQNLVIWRY